MRLSNALLMEHLTRHVLCGVIQVTQFGAYDDLWFVDVTNCHLSNIALTQLRTIASEVTVERHSRFTRLWITL